MRKRVAAIEEIPFPDKTDEQLKLGEISKIFPETWKNIPFVVHHALGALATRVYEQTKAFEGLKEYSVAQNTMTTQSLIKSLEQSNAEKVQLEIRIDRIEKNVVHEVRNLRLEFKSLISTVEADL